MITAPTRNPDAGNLLRNADPSWRDCARRAAAELARRGQDFTADDLTGLGVPDPDHPARWGSLFSTLKREGIITLVNYRASTKPSRNGGVVRVWRGTAAA